MRARKNKNDIGKAENMEYDPGSDSYTCKNNKKEERTKAFYVAKTFLAHREKDLERILSEKGILLRTNRSIQVEGSFGDLKQDMQFRRYLSRGAANVFAESILLAMAKNINKLHNKIQNDRIGRHLFPIKSRRDFIAEILNHTWNLSIIKKNKIFR